MTIHIRMKSHSMRYKLKRKYNVAPCVKLIYLTPKALQQQDRFCIRIAKMMEDLKSRFNERDSYEYDNNGLLHHLNKENGREYKVTIVPKVLIPTVLKEMHDHFGHYVIEKTYSLNKRHYYYWPKMIKHIQGHVDSYFLCRREKCQHDKSQ